MPRGTDFAHIDETGMRSDAELVATAAGGDQLAVEVLYRRYAERLRSYVSRRLRPGDVDDVSAEVWASALRGLRRGHVPRSTAAWLFGIAHNACVDELRQRRAPVQPLLERHERIQAVSGAGRSASEVAEERSELSALVSAIGSLAESHRRVLLLRELDGLDNDAIARLLGISRSAVEGRLLRARRSLRLAGAAVGNWDRA